MNQIGWVPPYEAVHGSAAGAGTSSHARDRVDSLSHRKGRKEREGKTE